MIPILEQWRKAAPGRHVHYGHNLIALRDDTRSVCAIAVDDDEAARRAVKLWNEMDGEHAQSPAPAP